MVLEGLSNSLKETLKKITKAIFVDETLINELVKDIQKALLKSDVNVKLVLELTNKIKKRALEEKTPSSINQKEHLVRIVYEELVKFLGSEQKGINILAKKPFKIMFVGLFGAGKTTSIFKVAKYYSKRGYKVGVIGLDIHRPAAMAQIEQLGNQINVPVFIDKKEKKALNIYKKFKDDLNKFDIILIDTAGRDALSEDLIEEINDINNEIKPEERILVISADIGQTAQEQAVKFHETCNITGVLITKMDGTAKGGGAMSACAATQAPVKFIGVGEKIEDIEEFNPDGFVSRLLGMGDLKALLEKTREAIDDEQAEKLGKRMIGGEFNFIDLYEQMEAMQKMGPLNKIVDLIPGMGNMNIPKEMLNVQEEKLKKWKFIMNSCTKEELENPDIITRTRIDRIANGSGTTAREVRELLKQYKQSKKMMKLFKGSSKDTDINKLMKKFKGKGMRMAY